MQTSTAGSTTTDEPEQPRAPFRVCFLDHPAAPAQTAPTYTEALAGIARARRCPLAGLFTVYDAAAHSFLVWLPGALDASMETEPVATVSR